MAGGYDSEQVAVRAFWIALVGTVAWVAAVSIFVL